jgi:ABC-type uncharacterized transport system substrate-binding protein
LDTVLFPDPAAQQELRDFYIRKYQNRRPDVIITVGPSPLKFMLEVHQKAFPGVPIVFCLPYGNAPGTPALDSNFTGVENDMAPAETLEIALRLQPGTKHVVVVSGVSDFDKQGRALVMQHLKAFTDQIDIRNLTDLAMPDLLERLRQLPNHTVVLLVSVGQDAEGTRFKSNEVGPMVADAANAPVFSLFDVFLNHGEVGGYLSSLNGQGKIAGDMALRLLNAEKPQDIPRVTGVNAYMFDWRALRRWGLNESVIPPGSIVLNRESTVWESYKSYFIGGIFFGPGGDTADSGAGMAEGETQNGGNPASACFRCFTGERTAFPPGLQHSPSTDLDVWSRQAVQLLQSALAGFHRSHA